MRGVREGGGVIKLVSSGAICFCFSLVLTLVFT